MNNEDHQKRIDLLFYPSIDLHRVMGRNEGRAEIILWAKIHGPFELNCSELQSTEIEWKKPAAILFSFPTIGAAVCKS
jgi:hypothetical protein